MEIYCLKCKIKTVTNEITYVKTINNKNRMKGICVVCGCKKSSFTTEIKGG